MRISDWSSDVCSSDRLLEAREQLKRRRVHLVRLEQLYPFPKQTLARQLARFPNADVVWFQEEPQNMGSWSFVAPRLEQAMAKSGCKNYIERGSLRARWWKYVDN